MPTFHSSLVFLASTVTPGLGRSTSQVPLQVNESHARKVITDELSSYIQTELQAHNVTGLSLGVILPDGEVEYAAWGNRAEDGEPVTSQTIFNLGSCSKAFLSASLGILMQDFADGRNKSALPDGITEFTWDTKMRRDLLPGEWMTEDEWTTSKASLKDLLSHVTGLPGHDGSCSPLDSPDDLVHGMKHLRAAYELRERYEYNNQVASTVFNQHCPTAHSKRKMYVIGAFVVSEYPGSSYRDFVAERILVPLRMTSSTLYPDRAFETGRFTQSWTASRRRIPFFMPEHTAELNAGPGGVMSTVEDVALWVKILLNAGVDAQSNATIIPKNTFVLATSAISVAKKKKQGTALFSIAGYGLGWGRLSYAVMRAERHAHVADRMLGFPEVDVEAVVEPVPVTQLQRPQAPSHNVSFAGTYSNAGYGTFTLCSPPPSLPPPTASPSSKTSERSTQPPATPRLPSTSTARGRGSGGRISTCRLFLLGITRLYVEGFGADRTPFEDVASETFGAKFMRDSEGGKVVGLGMYVAGGGSWRVKKGGSVRDTVDVWFEKL
ncbi:beta-lactamase/transpeptidase-like protein [Mycena polygramma]|nr:beta-lactamase/transpeptidase-like protein [Mycena polygramma]